MTGRAGFTIGYTFPASPGKQVQPAGVIESVGISPYSRHEEKLQVKTKSTIIAMMLAALPAVALAQSTGTTSTPRVDQRQAEQQKRINQGVQSGQLTAKETARLEKGQAHVQKMENKAVADNKVTKKERAHIAHAQDKQSRKIHREKHDKQTAK